MELDIDRVWWHFPPKVCFQLARVLPACGAPQAELCRIGCVRSRTLATRFASTKTLLTPSWATSGCLCSCK